MYHKSSLLLIFCLLFLNFSNSQNSDQVFKIFDSIVGLENTILYNGFEFQDSEVTINEKNKFLFPESDYQIGSVRYSNQYFPEVPLKFNVVDDRLFVKITYGNTSAFFQLISEKVEEFSIQDKNFKRLDFPEEVNGFYQELFTSQDYSLYKKYRKTAKEKFDRNFLYYEFNFSEPSYLIVHNNRAFRADSKNDLTDIFPDRKKEIKSFYKDQKSLSQRNMDAFMQNLVKEMTNQKTMNP
ncbi:hypothetical protein E0K83_07100 [Gramella sp. BOM4]|nr:hypothetical protein [Christiangramia bathymodioli]